MCVCVFLGHVVHTQPFKGLCCCPRSTKACHTVKCAPSRQSFSSGTNCWNSMSSSAENTSLALRVLRFPLRAKLLALRESKDNTIYHAQWTSSPDIMYLSIVCPTPPSWAKVGQTRGLDSLNYHPWDKFRLQIPSQVIPGRHGTGLSACKSKIAIVYTYSAD